MDNVVLVIITALISGLLAAILTIWRQNVPELIRNPESLKSLTEIGEKYGGKK